MELSRIERKLEEMKENLEETTFKMEMFKEMKINAKRWFIIAIIFAVAFITSNIAWFIYESQFETVTDYEQTIEDIDTPTNSEFRQTIN